MNSWADLVPPDLPPSELRAALVDLCNRGLVTCTSGEPGADGATYALGWLPLDDAERYPLEIRARHERNRRRLLADASFTIDGGSTQC